MFLKKIGKKIFFHIRRKKALFLDFYSQALLNALLYSQALEVHVPHLTEEGGIVFPQKY